MHVQYMFSTHDKLFTKFIVNKQTSHNFHYQIIEHLLNLWWSMTYFLKKNSYMFIICFLSLFILNKVGCLMAWNLIPYATCLGRIISYSSKEANYHILFTTSFKPLKMDSSYVPSSWLSTKTKNVNKIWSIKIWCKQKI
jgi:hypothetical protein